MYVTVLVTVSRTRRTLERVVFGDLTSKYRPPPAEKSQSNGERALRALKGERRVAAVVALSGELMGEKAGDSGIRSRPSRALVGADEGYVKGVGGAVVETGDWDL